MRVCIFAGVYVCVNESQLGFQRLLAKAKPVQVSDEQGNDVKIWGFC